MADFISKKWDKILIIFIFVVGILFRLYFYLQNSSLWFDEAGLAMNLITKSYKSLLGGLDYLQAAPAGFCLMEKVLIDIFKTNNDMYRDYILRLLPLLAGILSLPAFFYLAKLVFNDKSKIFFAFAIFSLNTHAILYCSQCKQYTTELLLSVILIVFFIKILRGEYNWLYSFFIATAPWFSYSSFFVITAGMFALFIKKRRYFLYCILPLILSCVVYYFLSLKSVVLLNYSGMDQVWITFKAFADLHHPMRLLIRFGELFMLTKPYAILSAAICFYAFMHFCFEKKELSLKLLLILPVIIVIIASLGHKYPIYSRLILFLLPACAIAVADLNGSFGKFLKIIFGLVVIYSLLNNSIYAKEMAYSYARDVISYIKDNIKDTDAIIMDNDSTEYYFYMVGKSIDNQIYKMPVTCIKGNVDICKDYINSLPNGDYYFLSSHDNVVDVARDYKMYDLPFKPKYVKAVYFENRG